MRVLYVFRSLAYWGGIERILVDKMNNLVSMYGYEVYMLTTDQGCHPVPYHLDQRVQLKDLGIKLHQQYRYHGIKRGLILWKLLRLYKQRLSKELVKINPDVIVCTTSNYWDVNILAKIKGKTPLVVECHSIYKQTIGLKGLKGSFSDYLYKKGLSHAQTIVTLTEKDACDWRQIHKCVKVIPNMVHLNEGEVSSLQNKHVIWVGRFDYQKRPLEMIDIWKKVYPKFPDWHLDMYGEGELLNEVEEKARSLNMNIHIHQPTINIFDCYRRSSFLVSTSLFEPFGLVIPEAMSCGLPVVAYKSSYGPVSILSDGIDGCLVEMNNGKVMTQVICALMNDKNKRLIIGQSAKNTSLKYSREIIMPMWNALFNDILMNLR